VTNGESAGNTLRRTFLGGAALSWQDVLHEGPVPAGPRRDLLRARAGFLAECGWGGRSALLSAFERRDRLLLDALESGTHVVFWFEHDLYDQLQLVDALALGHEAGGAVDLVVVNSFQGNPQFRGLGELDADELETLWPGRTRATPETSAAAVRVWEAFRAPDPVALAECAAQEHDGLPFVGAALVRLLEELPAPGDGLSGTERRALQAVADGAGTPIAAFLAEQELEEAPFLGDAWFFRALAALSRGPERLVETRTGEELPPAPPLGETHGFRSIPLRLTRRGAEVLSGEADRLALLGIDRWLGGTHLTARSLWRWDPTRHLLAADI